MKSHMQPIIKIMVKSCGSYWTRFACDVCDQSMIFMLQFGSPTGGVDTAALPLLSLAGDDFGLTIANLGDNPTMTLASSVASTAIGSNVEPDFE